MSIKLLDASSLHRGFCKLSFLCMYCAGSIVSCSLLPAQTATALPPSYLHTFISFYCLSVFISPFHPTFYVDINISFCVVLPLYCFWVDVGCSGWHCVNETDVSPTLSAASGDLQQCGQCATFSFVDYVMSLIAKSICPILWRFDTPSLLPSAFYCGAFFIWHTRPPNLGINFS